MRLDHRAELGRLSERVAARYVTAHGGKILGRNIRVGRGEIDLLAEFEGVRTVIEVRSTTGVEPPSLRFDRAKASQVRTLARSLRASRIEVIAIRYTPTGVEIHRLIPTI